MFLPCGVKPDAAFTTRGFENIKKAIEWFLAHESSAPHRVKDEMGIKIQANFSAIIECEIC